MDIRHYKYPEKPNIKNTAIALGYFDGVHIGHKALISLLVREARAKGLSPYVLTFESSIQETKKMQSIIYNLEEKIEIFASLGVEGVIVADFNSISGLSPESFVGEVLIDALGAELAISGYNFRFGKGAAADSSRLIELMESAGRCALVLSEQKIDGKTLSATAIRELIGERRLGEAARMLGAPYCITGTVEKGLGLGKGFGFKTIYVIALSSLLFEVLPKFPQLEVMMDEKLLVALIGAAMESIGIGLVLLRGGSTGGTDIVAMIINKYWPVSPGRVYLFSDIFIISLLLLVPGKGIVDMIYAYVMMIGFSFGVDYVLLGNKSSVQILVISPKYKDIADHVINNVQRGVTALQSMGWYSQQESKVLLIVARKHEMTGIVNEIKEIDKNAFISISTAMSVFGEGFEEIKTGIKLKKNEKNELISDGK